MNRPLAHGAETSVEHHLFLKYLFLDGVAIRWSPGRTHRGSPSICPIHRTVPAHSPHKQHGCFALHLPSHTHT